MPVDALPDRYLFSLSEFTTNPWSFEEDIDHYSKLGVDAIEVCEAKLHSSGLPEQLELLEQSGLAVSSIQPACRTLFPSESQPTPEVVSSRVSRFRQTIRDLASIADTVPFVTNTGRPPNGNGQLVLDTAVREYGDLADFAADFGAKIALEPLNPTIMNVESAIWTLEQAMLVVHAVDRHNFGVCLDFWNIWQNPAVESAIESCGDRIFVTQVSDWRMPQSYQDRLVPGQGEIPLPRLISATMRAGYRGAYEVEIFSQGVPDSLWAGDLVELIRNCREGMDAAWSQAHHQ